MKTKSYHITVLQTCFLTVFLMICLTPNVWSQKVEYQYDAAGNRKLRKVITLRGDDPGEGGKSKSAASDMQNTADAVSAAERYEDLLGERKIMIYPNPTQGIIRVEFQDSGFRIQEAGEMKNARLLLYNALGKLLQQVNRVNATHTLDLSQYPAGVYILQIVEDKEKSEWKIVKE